MGKIQRNFLLRLQLILMSLVLMLGSMTIAPNTALADQMHWNNQQMYGNRRQMRWNNQQMYGDRRQMRWNNQQMYGDRRQMHGNNQQMHGNLEPDPNLGPLAHLEGTWYGQGWNMIAIPIKRVSGTHTECTIDNDSDSKESFCIHAEPFCDVLDFNKKTQTVDKLFPENITVFGLEYEHTVFSSNSWKPGDPVPACPNNVSENGYFKKIHGEKGAWLLLGEEQGKDKVARIFSLTRGNTVLALGQAQSQKLEEIKETGGFPVAELGKDRERYNGPYRDLRDILKGDFNLENPNEVLDQRLIKGNATVLEVSTDKEGGAIASIPFFDMANGVEGDFQIPKFKSTFWIENTNNKSELQLQYSETTDFDFRKDLSGDLVLWPHVDVSTLCKDSYCN